MTAIVFWSMGCEASWEHLRRLDELRSDYGGRLAVVAVHSPRHDYERDETLVDAAVVRAGFRLPVVHDPDLETWSRYSPPGWPSTVVIDHRGRIVGTASGLDSTGVLRDVVELCDAVARSGRNDDSALHPLPEPVITPSTSPPDELRWPSGLAVLADGRIAVVDSGNDRLLVFELGPDVRLGRFDVALDGIERPDQVVEFEPGVLAVSQPLMGRVLTVDVDSDDRRVLIDGLVRPRGLTIDDDGSLVIADAGAERLVRVTTDGSAGTIAGTGFSGITDGGAARAELSQPVAVCRTPAGVAFIDAGSGSLRVLTDRGRVLTTTATPPIEPGLVDGPIHRARLQRPTALTTMADGSIAIVDGGNNRVRILAERRLSTLGVAGLDHPEAITQLPSGHLLIADTGNHRLVVADAGGHEVWELELIGLLPDPTIATVRRSLDRWRSSVPLVGQVGQRIAVDHPTPGPGPWTITAWSEPRPLLGEPLQVERSTAGKLALDPLEPGKGTLHIEVVGSDPADIVVITRDLVIRS